MPLDHADPYYDAEPAEDKFITGLFRTAFCGPRMTSKHFDHLLASMRPALVALDEDWSID